jgi:predicted transposase/invertase (TIGR01784 family)
LPHCWEYNYESIEQFNIINPDISPEELGKKFCRLDINMIVNGQIIDLEVQVSDEGNYPERSLYYWAREYSTGLNEGEDYSLLPRTIVISILGFNLFASPEKFHSEFQALEVTSHEPLTDKMVLHFYELPKLPPLNTTDNGRDLWLKLFKAQTEEELTKIEEMGVPYMSEAVVAYRNVTASPEFRAIQRAMHKAGHDEAQAIRNAERRGAESERQKWQAEIEKLRQEIAELREQQADSKK